MLINGFNRAYKLIIKNKQLEGVSLLQEIVGAGASLLPIVRPLIQNPRRGFPLLTFTFAVEVEC